MQLINANKIGLIFWGTKRGKSVFFSINIRESNGELNDQLNDIQSYISFQRINHEFYCFDFQNEYKGLSIIHSLNDALGRIGYVAVSIIIPANKTFQSNNTQQLLKQLLDMYLSRYVVADYVKKTINESVRESPELFEQAVNGYSYVLVDDPEYDRARIIKPRSSCFLQFPGHADLLSIFQFYDREELRQFEKVFVLPAGKTDLTANVQFTELRPPVRKVQYKFRVFDDADNDILYGVSLQVHTSGQGSKSLICDAAVTLVLPENETFTISAQKAGYAAWNRSLDQISPLLHDGVREIRIMLRKSEQPKPVVPSPSPALSSSQSRGSFNETTAPKKYKPKKGVWVGIVAIFLVPIGFVLYNVFGSEPIQVGPETVVTENCKINIDSFYNAFLKTPNREDSFKLERRIDSALGCNNDPEFRTLCERVRIEIRKPAVASAKPNPINTDKVSVADIKHKLESFEQQLRNASSKKKFDDIIQDLKDYWKTNKTNADAASIAKYNNLVQSQWKAKTPDKNDFIKLMEAAINSEPQNFDKPKNWWKNNAKALSAADRNGLLNKYSKYRNSIKGIKLWFN